jgi:hypothetical protein
VRGSVAANGLNPEGQIVENDDVSIIADIQKGPGSKYQELPEGMYVREPEGVETPYTPGSGPSNTMTHEEYYGVDIIAHSITGFPLRNATVWRAYGGLEDWSKNAPESVTKEFKGVIPLKYAGKTFRIRATLRHQWGGPFANWPAISFAHSIGYEGTLERVVQDTDNDGVPDFKDECCTTPPGVSVDERGCPNCKGNKIYDPSSAFADPNTGCSPKIAVIFTTNSDPHLDWRHKLLMSARYPHISDFFKSKGYKIISVNVPGTIDKNGAWTANVDEIVSYLIKPSTKAIAYFGHGGVRTKDRPFWWDDYASSLDGTSAASFLLPTYNQAKEFYQKKYCLSDKNASDKALAKASNIGLDYAYIFACHSLDDNKLRNFLISDTGTFWGEPGVLTGVAPLKEVKGKGVVK